MEVFGEWEPMGNIHEESAGPIGVSSVQTRSVREQEDHDEVCLGA